MKGYIYGEITKPMTILIGTWDPLLKFYVSLIKEMVAFSKKNKYAPVVVMLDPSPSIYIRKKQMPVFDDIEYRIEIMKSIGVEGIILVKMGDDDINQEFMDLYRILKKFGVLKSLWLSNNQTLGRGVKGSQAHIRKVGEQLGFEVKIKAFKNKVSTVRSEIQQLLNAGKLSNAITKVGNQSFWKRPEQNFIKITGWKTGNYMAVPLQDPFQADKERDAIPVEIKGMIPGKSYIKWPSQEIKWLKFIE